jgi:hypothetical protein
MIKKMVMELNHTKVKNGTVIVVNGLITNGMVLVLSGIKMMKSIKQAYMNKVRYQKGMMEKVSIETDET